MKHALRKGRAAINEIDVILRRAGEHDAYDGANIRCQMFSEFAPRPYPPLSQFQRLAPMERKAGQNAKERARARARARN